MNKIALLVTVAVCVCSVGHAAIKTENVEYKDGDTALEGYIAWDDAVKGKRSGVLVVHEWWGLNKHAKHSAEKLAELGYVGFAVDMYGKGKNTTKIPEATQWSTELKKDPDTAIRRFNTAYELLKKRETVDPEKIAAIGYCFGGTMVLEAARSGDDLKGVTSFHGGLTSSIPPDKRHVKAAVLVCHGADDPLETPEDIANFQKEMRDGKVDWQFKEYGGAMHSFTNPDADSYGLGPAKYNEKAARRSWEDMKAFLAEVLGGGKK